ncbi:uncharacterized protein LACBIDRAFT_329018 [Laccaria bicolor S238N-H82]|uniref:Predicted protein n=1 Tax=Laccaria bicolor (strain S238N-H82 / ATCC MYA-4686) TaxID=486041 RepID=B0DGS5_LACBS|nr:uncharacterized protein LACBIDRAFT_329018 [Laccaria bicolor S238N-H82]EDR06202.1 predicted protein [Laccaria bicolor S238N-H82]|eukprot:XP_001883063.1 predicted protein [Laccaria bicolor S238N-H82]
MLTSISLTPATPPPYRPDEPILSVLYRDYKDFTFRQTDYNILSWLMIPNITFELYGEKEGGKLLEAYHEQFKAEVALRRVSSPTFIKQEDGEPPKQAEVQELVDRIVARAEMELKLYRQVQNWIAFEIL